MGQPGCEHRVQLAAELGASLCRGEPWVLVGKGLDPAFCPRVNTDAF